MIRTSQDKDFKNWGWCVAQHDQYGLVHSMYIIFLAWACLREKGWGMCHQSAFHSFFISNKMCWL